MEKKKTNPRSECKAVMSEEEKSLVLPALSPPFSVYCVCLCECVSVWWTEEAELSGLSYHV